MGLEQQGLAGLIGVSPSPPPCSIPQRPALPHTLLHTLPLTYPHTLLQSILLIPKGFGSLMAFSPNSLPTHRVTAKGEKGDQH